ncbi:hypothetical protein AAV94_09235 [Lampropedia cohaerens]|uniref:Type II secretion system protein N n=1 Tax=Lampropedia cohaerens TaxID=1610491 RepID=A0A0U1PZ51_9BURK|nr:type II secretion system protein N [Lampropedia cohaerens]KKW67794.1 hypothetical protein AAV94_09235 [Lampropedia cohaerens]
MAATAAIARHSAMATRRAGYGGWALAGALLGVLLAAVLLAPARWLAGALAMASDGRVQLQQARGSLWNGSASLTLTGGAGSRDRMALPGRLHWQLRPAWLGLNVAMRPDCCATADTQARLRLGWGRAELTVDAHESRWPSSLLQGLGAPFNTLQLGGDLHLQMRDLRLQWVQGRTLMQGTIEALLRDATSRLTTIAPMGSYRLIMQGGEQVRLTLRSDSGPLLLSGQGQWQGQRLRFQGEARASAPEHLPALSNLLSLLGRRDGERAILSL